MSPQSGRSLALFPCCGLCNRIQATICGQLLAEDTHRDFFLNWTPADDCGAAFTDLFAQVFPALDDLPQNVSCYSSIQRHIGAAPQRYGPLLERRPLERFAAIKREKSATVAIFTCHQFLSYFHDPRFTPRLRELFTHLRPEIESQAEDFRRRWFTDTTIGVHIRRQDWRSQRDLAFYTDCMRKFPEATFFVSSDEPASIEEIRRQFPTIVSFPKSTMQRNSLEAIQHALVDVVLLAKTSYLIGTPGSSFSAVAQTVGGIPGNFDYGLSLSVRDFKLGNLANIGRIMMRRLQRRR